MSILHQNIDQTKFRPTFVAWIATIFLSVISMLSSVAPHQIDFLYVTVLTLTFLLFLISILFGWLRRPFFSIGLIAFAFFLIIASVSSLKQSILAVDSGEIILFFGKTTFSQNSIAPIFTTLLGPALLVYFAYKMTQKHSIRCLPHSSSQASWRRQLLVYFANRFFLFAVSTALLTPGLMLSIGTYVGVHRHELSHEMSYMAFKLLASGQFYFLSWTILPTTFFFLIAIHSQKLTAKSKRVLKAIDKIEEMN